MITAKDASKMVELRQRARTLSPLVDAEIRRYVANAHLFPATTQRTVDYYVPEGDDVLAAAIGQYYSDEGGWVTRVCYGEYDTKSCWVELRVPETAQAKEAA